MKKSSEQYIKGNTSRFALTVGEFNVLFFFMLKPNEKVSKMNYLAVFGAHVIILLLLYIFLNVFLNIWRQFFKYISRETLMKNKILRKYCVYFQTAGQVSTTGFQYNWIPHSVAKMEVIGKRDDEFGVPIWPPQDFRSMETKVTSKRIITQHK